MIFSNQIIQWVQRNKKKVNHESYEIEFFRLDWTEALPFDLIEDESLIGKLDNSYISFSKLSFVIISGGCASYGKCFGLYVHNYVSSIEFHRSLRNFLKKAWKSVEFEAFKVLPFLVLKEVDNFFIVDDE